ncbi:MAG: NAD(P)-dependent oxidoreductase [Chromatiales bacterium]|nr:NAD(P)-dependent oxidoreductase [Chromatiales bacterium]
MQNCAVIGIGLMGKPFAERLLDAGYPVIAYNRDATKTLSLAERGARLATAPAEAVQAAEVVVLVLSDAAAIDAALSDIGADAPLTDKIIVQMGTIGPSESRALAGRIAAAGGRYLEAPVLGSIPEANSGTLQIMVGGERELYEQLLPLLKVFGKEPRHIGPVGQAAAVKLALNQLIAALTTGFSLSLGLIRHSGASVDTFMELLRESALYAPTYDKKLDRMLRRDYSAPNFPTKHLLKDVDLLLRECEPLSLNTAALAGIREILGNTIAQGLSNTDYSALYQTVDPS